MAFHSNNPFHGIQKGKYPHARALRSNLWTKYLDTVLVIFGVTHWSAKVYFSNSTTIRDSKLGIIDYLGIGVVFSAIMVLLKVEVKLINGLRDMKPFFQVLFAFLFALSIIVTAALALPLPIALVTYGLTVALSIPALIIVTAVHAVTSIISYNSKKLVTEMIESGLLRNGTNDNLAQAVMGPKMAKSIYRLFISSLDGKNKEKTQDPTLCKFEDGLTFKLDKTVIAPGSLSMFNDRMTNTQKDNLKYTNALAEFDMFTDEIKFGFM